MWKLAATALVLCCGAAATATPIIRNGIASYYNSDPSDQLNHAIVATTDGVLHEIYYSNTTVFGSDTLATFTPGTIVGIGACYGNGANHVIVQQNSGNITEVYWVGGQGVHTAFLTNFLQPDAIGNCFFDQNGTAHVPFAVGPQGTTVGYQVEYSPSIGIHVYEIGFIGTQAKVRGITAWMANWGVSYVSNPVVAVADDNTVLYSNMQFGFGTSNTFHRLTNDALIPSYNGSTPVGVAGFQINPSFSTCNQDFFVGTNANGNWNLFGSYDQDNINGIAPCTDWSYIYNFTYNPTAVSAFATDGPPQRHVVMSFSSNSVYQWLQTSATGPWYSLYLGTF